MAEEYHVWVQKRNGRKFLSLEWIDPETKARKQVSAKTADQTEAERAAVVLETKLNHRLHENSSNMTWDRFRGLFRDEHCAGLRQATQDKYELVLDVFEKECRPTNVAKVRERVISKFVTRLRQRRSASGEIGLRPKTIHNYLLDLKTALKWAADQRIIGSVPKFPKIKVPKTRPQPVTQGEFDKLLQARTLDQEWRAYLLCAWWAGLRLSEAKCLGWSRAQNHPYVQMFENRIVVPAEFGKNCQDDWLPLHQQLREALEGLTRDGDMVFPNIWPLKRHSVVTRIGRAARIAGVRLSMHRLRKGFGCRVAQQLGKGDAPVLHRLMRHSSMQMTMHYYSNVDDALEDRMRQLK